MSHLFQLGQEVLAVLVDRLQVRHRVHQEGVSNQREPEVEVRVVGQQLFHQAAKTTHKDGCVRNRNAHLKSSTLPTDPFSKLCDGHGDRIGFRRVFEGLQNRPSFA